MPTSDRQDALAPAFEKPWQLWLFVFVVALFALLPLLPKPHLMDRAALYLAFNENSRGRSAYLANHILQDTGDIDILFLGGSSIDAAINPLIVNTAIEPLLSREPVVAVVAHAHSVVDMDYVILTDILAKRHLKLLVWHTTPSTYGAVSEPYMHYLFDWHLHSTALRHLAPDEQHAIYWSAVMNGVRVLLSPFKDRLPATEITICVNSEIYFGACRRKQELPNLEDGMPPPPLLSLDQLIHWRNKEDPVFIEKGVYTNYEQVFVDALFALAAEKGTRVVLMQAPGGNRGIITVPTMEPHQLGYKAPIIGAGVAELFYNRTPLEIERDFFRDGRLEHLHYAGADYFTRSMLPAIVAVYKQTVDGTFSQP